jgi:hypothetical protein
MKQEIDRVKSELEELFRINLNGQWQVFKDSCDDIKEEMDGMTVSQLRAIKSRIKDKIESTQIGSCGDVPDEPSEK